MNSTDLKNKVAHEGLNKPDLVVSSITGKIKQDFDKEIGNISGVNDNDQMISVKQRKEALLKKFNLTSGVLPICFKISWLILNPNVFINN